MTKFITIEEFDTMKLYEVEDALYRRIERTFAKAVGYTVAAKLMQKFAEKTLRQLSANSYVDIMSVFTIL